MKIEPLPARGTRDILPQEMELRDHALSVILRTFTQWGFSHIETPAVENLEVLLNSQAGENEKLIFKILKRGEKLELGAKELTETDLVDMGLRFDLTVPLARYYANNQSHLAKPFKAIQMGPVWRAERPQKGRFRQFTQCDIDIIGEPSINAEIELVLATSEALLNLGFKGFAVHLSDRNLINELLKKFGVEPKSAGSVYIIADKLEKIGPEGVKTELASLGLSPEQVQGLLTFLEKSPANPAIQKVVDAVKKQNKGQYQVVFDPSLVRGMGYYTGLIFEIKDQDARGNSIAGGGRYDKMIGNILGQEVPACGFSIGFERIIAILAEKKAASLQATQKIALLYDPQQNFEEVLKASQELRAQGHNVCAMAKRKNTRQQLDELLGQGFHGFTVFQSPSGPLEIKELKKQS